MQKLKFYLLIEGENGSKIIFDGDLQLLINLFILFRSSPPDELLEKLKELEKISAET